MGGVCRPERGINGAALPPVCCGRLRAAGENQTQKRAGATHARFFSARKNVGRWRGEAERRLTEGIPKRRLCAAPKECPEAAAMAAGFNPFPGGRASGVLRGSGFLSGRPAAAGRTRKPRIAAVSAGRFHLLSYALRRGAVRWKPVPVVAAGKDFPYGRKSS